MTALQHAAPGCGLCAATGPEAGGSSLAAILGAGRDPRIASNQHAVAVPTIGAFTAGYLLIVPRRHVLSLGQLDRDELTGLGALTDAMAARLRIVYRTDVLGFEYGLNVTGARRIEHAHLHLLPSRVDLAGWLSELLHGHRVASLLDLPDDRSTSYISVWDQSSALNVFPVPNDASPRIRLREIVAKLDPRLCSQSWDWQSHPQESLMRQTIDDLIPSPIASRKLRTTGDRA